MPILEGDLAAVGVPELFRALADEARTGCLTLTRGDTAATIFFRQGDAYHARVTGSGVRLGSRLVSAGVITEVQLEEALEMQRSEGNTRRLGKLLMEEGLIENDVIVKIVTQQIEDTMFDILRWEGGSWRFEDDVASDEDIGLHVSVENLVMEGARRFREWHHITRKVPSLEAIPHFDESEGSTPIDVALTPEEWAFVSEVDGRATISDLARGCGFTDLEAARTVYGLVTAGLLTLQLPEGVVVPEEDPDLEAAFDELEKVLEEAASRDSSRSLDEIAVEPEARSEIDTSSEVEEISELPGFDELPVIEESQRVGRGAGAIDEDLSVFAEVAEEPPAALGDAFTISESPDAQTIPAIDQVPESPVPTEPEPMAIEAEPIALEAESLVAEPEPVVADIEPIAVEAEPIAVEAEPIAVEYPVDDVVTAVEPLAGVGPESNGVTNVLVDEPEYALDAVTPVVLYEESTHQDYEPASSQERGEIPMSRLFAELSRPAPGPDVRAVPPQPDPAEDEGQKQPQAVLTASEPRPIDPSVDTSALLRELSGLGDERETSNGFDMGTVTAPPTQVAEKDDKSRGLFGKRRR